MIKKVHKKVFQMLNEDERASLALQQMHGKSTWQAGEIMKKSHYKYLEINQRAKRYLELFQKHYTVYGKLIPDGLKVGKEFSQYLIETIENRKTVKAAAALMGEPIYIHKKTREGYLTKEVQQLISSSKAEAFELYRLIIEFDKYNNFRILPSDIQEPSAYKRRNKTRFKKHLTTSLSLTVYVLDRLIELFKAKKNAKKVGYVVLATPGVEAKIVPVLVNESNVESLSSISIYIFNSEQTAKDYKILVEDFLDKVRNSPREGLRFWPRYRTIIQEAYNFSQVNNIVPSRKNVLISLRLMDEKHHQERADLRLKRTFGEGI